MQIKKMKCSDLWGQNEIRAAYQKQTFFFFFFFLALSYLYSILCSNLTCKPRVIPSKVGNTQCNMSLVIPENKPWKERYNMSLKPFWC